MPMVSVKADAVGVAARIPMKEVNESFIVVVLLCVDIYFDVRHSDAKTASLRGSCLLAKRVLA